jgi:hypothetical protein
MSDKLPVSEAAAGGPAAGGPAGATDGRDILVLRNREACGYVLVASLTVIMLAHERRDARLQLFGRALDDFERGAFEAALRLAREASAPTISATIVEIALDVDAMRERLDRLLTRKGGRA